MKLTETQIAVLSAAVLHPEGRVEHFPTKVTGGARLKVLIGLEARGLISQESGQPVLTHAGYRAIGWEPPALAEVPTPPASGTAKPRRARENSKQAEVIRMLRRPEGATIAQICEATEWLPHTVRGTFAGTLRKKLGLNLVSEKAKGQERVYRLADDVA